jgi:hypothetical protein
MADELTRVAGMCDGVRCDMAMLLLPEVFRRTWGDRSLPADGTPRVDAPFWPGAVAQARACHPGFVFMAEVYWDLEWALQQQGFDYTYDKKLYDRLLARDAEAVRGHLHADPEYQRRSVRFLENHDEPRAASALPWEVQRAAAVIADLVPGLRFFHDGQFEGRRLRESVHLGRRAAEPADPAVRDFYRRLLGCVRQPAARAGCWQLLECRPAWPGNPTWTRFVAFTWEGPQRERLLVAVNYGPTQAQCFVRLSGTYLRGNAWRFRDRMGDACYDRDGGDLAERGLYLDVPPWHYHVFAVEPLRA